MGPARQAALDLLDRTFRSKPLLFITSAWIAGIWLADLWAASPVWPGSLGLLLGAAALASRQRWHALGLLLAGVVALGLAATRSALLPPGGDISEWNGRQVGVAGIVYAEPVAGCDYWRFMVNCLSVTYAGRGYPARGRLYVTTEQDLSRLEPGDEVLVYGVPERPSPARNPGGYSRECWLARRGAFAVAAVRPGAVVRLTVTSPDWRQRIAAANQRVMTNRQAAALVNSMLFGDLDSGDTRSWGATEERFRRAGVSHVLVVSGAQAALLFGLLSIWRRWALRSRRHDRRHWRVLRAAGGYSYRQALGGGLVLLALYVPLVGLQPSILRPALVVTIFFLGRMLDREVDPENSLAAAALILLVANPLTLYDLSFQLSFAAVWGIIRWTGPLAAVLAPVKPRKEDAPIHEPSLELASAGRANLATKILAMTLAAQFATLPLIAHQFQTLSLVAPSSNLPIIAMMTLLLPLGMASSTLNVVAGPAHVAPSALLHWANWPTELLAQLIDASVTVFAHPTWADLAVPPRSWAEFALVGALLVAVCLPLVWTRRSLSLAIVALAVAVFAHPAWASLPVSPPSWAEVALIALLLLVASLPSVLRRRPLSLTIVALALIVLAISAVRPAPAVSAPTLTFIDVGQGDGCLVRLPGGATILVDGGGSPRAPCLQRDCSDAPAGHLADSIRKDCTDIGRDILAGYLRHERVRRIDLMVLTHPHDDHLWGLDALLDRRQRFDIGAVLDAGQPFASPANREWLKLIQRRHIKLITARRGMELAVGPARLTVLHPPGVFLSHTRNDPNNNSIVLRLDVGGSRVLLTGDAEAETEAVMANQDVTADVLKVGHHGSAYSTSDAWLDRVQPRIAVVSCGRHNAFGHPSPDTLERLRRHGVQTYRTDRDGAVTLELRPEGWTATTMVGPSGGQ